MSGYAPKQWLLHFLPDLADMLEAMDSKMNIEDSEADPRSALNQILANSKSSSGKLRFQSEVMDIIIDEKKERLQFVRATGRHVKIDNRFPEGGTKLPDGTKQKFVGWADLSLDPNTDFWEKAMRNWKTRK